MGVQVAGERWGVCLSGASLACNVYSVTCLQSLQSLQCHSQFTPPGALSKLLQKQPGGSNTLSGERSHLNKKEPFSAGFPNINTSQPGLTTMRALRDPAVSVPCQREVLPLCNHPMQCATASKSAADVSLVINVKSQVITWFWEIGL